MIFANTPYLTNISFIQICAMSFAEISFVYAIKYPYLVNLSTIINIILCSCPVIGSFNFNSLTIKSYCSGVGRLSQIGSLCAVRSVCLSVGRSVGRSVVSRNQSVGKQSVRRKERMYSQQVVMRRRKGAKGLIYTGKYQGTKQWPILPHYIPPPPRTLSPNVL